MYGTEDRSHTASPTPPMNDTRSRLPDHRDQRSRPGTVPTASPVPGTPAACKASNRAEVEVRNSVPTRPSPCVRGGRKARFEDREPHERNAPNEPILHDFFTIVGSSADRLSREADPQFDRTKPFPFLLLDDCICVTAGLTTQWPARNARTNPANAACPARIAQTNPSKAQPAGGIAQTNPTAYPELPAQYSIEKAFASEIHVRPWRMAPCSDPGREAADRPSKWLPRPSSQINEDLSAPKRRRRNDRAPTPPSTQTQGAMRKTNPSQEGASFRAGLDSCMQQSIAIRKADGLNREDSPSLLAIRLRAE